MGRSFSLLGVPEGSRESLRLVLESTWPRVCPHASEPAEAWEMRVSPPFPLSWPPKSEGQVKVYAYAARREGLADGERLSGLWATAVVDADGRQLPGSTTIIPSRTSSGPIAGAAIRA